MITIEFTEEEKQALHHERFHHPHPRVQLKMEAIWLKSQELPHNEICRLTCISRPALCSYLKDYKDGGIAKLKEISFYRPQSVLQDYKCELRVETIRPCKIKEYFSIYSSVISSSMK